MSGGYVLIASVLLYMLLLRTLDSPRLNPVKAAAIWALGFYMLESLIIGLELSARGQPVVPALFDPLGLVVLIVQFAVAVGVFYKIEDSADDYLSYALWSGVGLALIFFIVPSLTQQVFVSIGGLFF